MNDTEKLRRRIADSAAELLAEGKTAGCAVRIAQSGELLLSAEFGCADTDSGEPLQQDAVFRLASMTKPITAAAILLCEERGLLSVSDRLSEHLDRLLQSCSYTSRSGSCRPPVREITLLDLLSHTAGFENRRGRCASRFPYEYGGSKKLAPLSRSLLFGKCPPHIRSRQQTLIQSDSSVRPTRRSRRTSLRAEHRALCLRKYLSPARNAQQLV